MTVATKNLDCTLAVVLAFWLLVVDGNCDVAQTYVFVEISSSDSSSNNRHQQQQ